ncbi:MAG TPA: DEAD/DEAH box helicase [Saprospiraceae bacterium]|nr:DEAD/DEAH box helicase [Saprospiraceae bacterium]HMP23583.1 DEAD/DEAH box helicase [Saprospiraceae bacterium]
MVQAALEESYTEWGYGSTHYYFEWSAAIPQLVNHPLLFLKKSPTSIVQLIPSEPNLIVREKGKSIEVQFDHPVQEVGFSLIKETNFRYKVLEINKNHVEIASLFDRNKLVVPATGRKVLSEVINNLTNVVAVQSGLEEHLENIPEVTADQRIYALLLPAGEGFLLEFFVKPLQSAAPYLKPGKGTENVIGEVNNQQVQTRRDLKAELVQLKIVQNACPILLEVEGSRNLEWDIQDAEKCLQLLLELEPLKQNNHVVIEWPKGEKVRLAGIAGFDQLHMGIQREKDWFSVSGEVKVNEELVLSMQQLTKLLQGAKADSHFVEISNGQFLALTEQFRKRLVELSTVLDDKMRFHPLAAELVEEFAENANELKAAKHWKDLLKKLRDARTYNAQLPGTFQAEMRPYQLEGFKWLSQLAQWGVGACLADDMGLGKTIQTLAVLVDRAPQGPALVMAPVSVCRNWEREAARFAPTLRVQLFGEGDRQAMIETLQPFDVLVTSYNLMQIESAHFEKKHFATIVLDEAQAIKNRSTKRSKAVMNLQGDFKIITTGTPIENHLGELWNLFNFINPGLLGGIDRFNERFAIPIEKYKDDLKRRQLQKIIRPFVLRRRKNQVLDELPEKTEVVLNVELSAEERAFYEALRRDAVQRIESEAGDNQDKRFRILAELTKLRLAACHPKLAQENVPLGSSKLELFLETVEELLDNNHKALVFSQFVKHLEIIQQALQERNIHYQYLDGSTPPHKRQERIDAFQHGDGDLFLISLKAGGVGLNLTAADYVIHLDPWWNPAVEDQATDRAHRIGQQRPVTVYRLVAEATVEEKIVKLHELKRDLADSLLAGADMSGKMSADELLALIREG